MMDVQDTEHRSIGLPFIYIPGPLSKSIILLDMVTLKTERSATKCWLGRIRRDC